MANLKQVSICMAIMMLTILANLNESEAITLWWKKVSVKITNGLSQNKDLLVHCKSKDDDLGEHSLKSGESFEFSFRQKFMWKSLFFCGYTFDGAKQFSDVYNGETMECREHCWWEIKETGPCLYKDGQYTQCHSWGAPDHGNQNRTQDYILTM